MSLAPAARVTLGNFAYDTHLADIAVTLSLLPGVNQARAVLPSSVPLSANPGDKGIAELNGGEGAMTVLTGKIRQIARGFQTVTVTIADGGADLSRFRPAKTYEQQNAKEILRSLASDAGVDVGRLDLDLPLPAYVAHQRRTAAEHVAYLAALTGAPAALDGDGKLNATAPPGSQPELALLYGREIRQCCLRKQPDPTAQRVQVGSGPASAEEAPDALRPTRDPLPDGAPAPGADAIWQPVPALRTPGAAQQASQARSAEEAAEAHRIRAHCFLLPALRPGMVIQIQKLPDEFDAVPWMLTRVSHRLRPGFGGGTTFEGRQAGVSGGAGSLLSAIAGAVGGLP
jgi:hypothetical protein